MVVWDKEARVIKKKIFRYFLLRGILLRGLKVIVQDKFGNSFDDANNLIWWPYKSGIRVGVFGENFNNFVFQDVFNKMDKMTINSIPKHVYLAGKRRKKY